MNPSTSSARCEGQSPADNFMDDWLFLSPDSVGPQRLEVSREDQATEDKGKLKSKLISAWNSVKYGWSLKQKSKFSKSSPVIMLGQSYELSDQEDRDRFWRSFSSLLWLTYRRGFSPLAGGSLTTDSGWGCVLRTGQMLLAQGLLLHLMPPGWTWSHHAVRDDMDLQRGLKSKGGPVKRERKLSLDSHLNRPMEASHRRVVSWFADHPTAPFGIHNLVELGKSSGKKAGDWYGPSIAAHIIRKAVAASADIPNLVVYVAQDCTIYLEDVRALCERPPPQPWKSVIILVPVRLGGQDLNPSYITCVKSFHCKYPRKMSFSRMDPSCTIGFYAKGQKDFEALCAAVQEAVSTSAETYPMFIFAEGKSQSDERGNTPTNNITYIQRKKESKKNERRRVDTSSSMDEFVLL
ncbi:Cysteine protease ATG4D [Collichthys lucidus]|uniref:Cysteine protease n=1 Tax=Collichthys lucidus TaxID=240159 RepID=A0A4U5VS42_COLLU|nr:Cysteine protease ATG4D [Collichthys lucidus]